VKDPSPKFQPAPTDTELHQTREQWLEIGRLAELGLLNAELVHELRQPVFAIRASIQLLLARTGDGQGGLATTLLDQVTTLEKLIERYAASGRRVNGVEQPILLGPAVFAGVEMLRHRARSRHKELLLDLRPEEEALFGDAVAVQQITTNLVANAIDAARHQVSVRASGACLEVADDGPGISGEVRDHMFDPFYSTKPPGQGTGLGLSISRHLVERYGGRLDVTSDEAGTRFTVRFRRWADR